MSNTTQSNLPSVLTENGLDNQSTGSETFQHQGRPDATEVSSQSERSSNPSFVETLNSIAERVLFKNDWIKLREHIANYVPLRTLENTQNGIALFQELVKRNLISDGNFDFIRNAFCTIQRFDLVHLVDCVQDGDYSHLLGWTALLTEPQSRSGSHHTAVPNELPASREQLQDISVGGGAEESRSEPRYDNNYTRRLPDPATSGDSGDEKDSVVLQRTYRNVPQGSQLSPSRHGQGTTGNGPIAESSTSHEGTETDSDNRRIEPDSVNFNSKRANSQGVNSDDAQSEGAQPRGATAWVENPAWSCEHYDRYCDVQFSCCDNRFWPCHRCHNANSSCSARNRQSRDIKKLKCNRCGKIQEFPQNSPHCVECNIKFSDYFCPICQHLTGTVNHPFHCEKCGTCRVHSDRSFHCDVCGVCLDVQLRGNHKCRVGSAHDECCICLEDAFTGCQILPCSHKVHKECGTQMICSRINNTAAEEIKYSVEETQNLENQTESEESLDENTRPRVFENYITETIDTNFEFTRQDVPAIVGSLD